MTAQTAWRPLRSEDVDVCDTVGRVSEFHRLLIVSQMSRLAGVTFTADKQPLACIGAAVAHEAEGFVLKVFAFISPLALRRHPHALARGLTRLMRKLARARNLAAIDVLVDIARPRALLLANTLGFRFAGELRNPMYPFNTIWSMRWNTFPTS